MHFVSTISGRIGTVSLVLYFACDSHPAAAIDLLRGTVQYDLADTLSFDYLYPAYIRGLAYLESGDGRSAAREFQKLIDNPGMCWAYVTGPLARLQLGRAQRLMGDNEAARKSYREFLSIWKDADPDVPIYRQAKAECAQLKNVGNQTRLLLHLGRQE